MAEGLDVTACMYPYDFWATYLGSARFDDGRGRSAYGITYEDLVVAGTGERLTEATFAALPGRRTCWSPPTASPRPTSSRRCRSPWVMIGSDAILEPSDNNHPRATGCFARTLGRYVRDEGTLAWSTGWRR